jgi:hypothetical protein
MVAKRVPELVQKLDRNASQTPIGFPSELEDVELARRRPEPASPPAKRSDMKRFAMTVTLAILAASTARAAEGPIASSALLKNAPQVIAFLKKYKPHGEPLLYAGVLKFSVQKGEGRGGQRRAAESVAGVGSKPRLLAADRGQDWSAGTAQPVVAAETKRGDHSGRRPARPCSR